MLALDSTLFAFDSTALAFDSALFGLDSTALAFDATLFGLDSTLLALVSTLLAFDSTLLALVSTPLASNRLVPTSRSAMLAHRWSLEADKRKDFDIPRHGQRRRPSSRSTSRWPPAGGRAAVA